MGLDSRHVILTASPYFSSTPSSGFCGFFFFFWALWNCQSSQWPGQALSLWRWALKWCQPSSMDEGFEKGTMNWKKKGKNPSYLGNKTKGRRENVEEREKNRWGDGGCHRLTLPPLYSPANSEPSDWATGISSLEEWQRERQGWKKEGERKWEPTQKRERTREKRVARGRDGGRTTWIVVISSVTLNRPNECKWVLRSHGQLYQGR